jgi:hypothetical protein
MVLPTVGKKNGHQPELEALVLEINRATLRLEDCSDRLRKHTASKSEHGSETVTRKHDELRDWVHGQLEKLTQERDMRTLEKVQSELAKQAPEHIKSVLHQGPKPALREQECNAVELALNGRLARTGLSAVCWHGASTVACIGAKDSAMSRVEGVRPVKAALRVA